MSGASGLHRKPCVLSHFARGLWRALKEWSRRGPGTSPSSCFAHGIGLDSPSTPLMNKMTAAIHLFQARIIFRGLPEVPIRSVPDM
jgi:hypothetical protein